MARFNILGTNFDVKYLKYEGNTPYYQRRVPESLIPRFGKRMIKERLDPKKGRLVDQVQALADWHTSLFKGLNDNPATILPTEKEVARKLLYDYGLKEGAGSDDGGLQAKIDGYANYSNTPHLDDLLLDLQRKVGYGTFTRTDQLALDALKSPMPLMMSELFDIYLSINPKSPDWVKRYKRIWVHFLKIVGDMPVAVVDREVARTYRNVRESSTVLRRNANGVVVEQALKSGSVDREMKFLKAVFNKSIYEIKENVKNPFARLSSTKRGKDAVKKETLTAEEIDTLVHYCLKQQDSLSTVMLALCFSGARLGEIIGLRNIDLHLEEKVPHYDIVEYGEKTVKTSSSVRKVPIHPTLLPLLKKQLDQPSRIGALFPTYNNLLDKPKSDNASAAINKRLAKIFTDKHITTHCFRHTLKDAFVNANITEDRSKQFLGHSPQDIASNYGKGRSLELKYEDLMSAMPVR